MCILDERWTKLDQLLEKHKEDAFHIFATQVDPDAIGAAMGFHFLLQQRGIEHVQIFYCGEIAHPQNRSEVNRYNLAKSMRPIAEFAKVEEKENHIVLVDSSSIKDSRGLELDKTPLIVLDHHRGSTLLENEDNFIWVEDIGAASTLVVELIKASSIEISEEKQYIFAMLALGIHNDTSSMRCDGKRDREAFHFARCNCSTEEFYKLTDYTLPECYFDHIGSSYVSRSRQGSKMVMGAGKILSKHGDVLAKIADEAIQMEGVSLVVVWGIIDDEVRLCARSNDLSNPLDDLLKQRFGANSGGAKQSFGGKGIGGAKLELNFGFWAGSEVDKEVRQVVDKKIQTLVFSET